MDGPAALYIFARDLRLADHAGLAEANRSGPVVPLLILDRLLEASLRRSPRRAAFFCGAVTSLAQELERRGTRLIVRRGPRTRTAVRAARDAGAKTVVWSAGYDAASKAADRALQSGLEEAGLRALLVHDAPAVAPDETSAAHSEAGRGYRALVPYLAAWRRARRDAPELHPPAFAAASLASEPLPEAADFGASANASDASEELALARLEQFVAGAALAYSTARNTPAAATSQLSAHLSFGTLAARTVARRIAQRAEDPFLLAEERIALDAFMRALAERDFFLQLAWFFEGAADAPLQAKMERFAFASKHPALAAWRAGRTGFPLVDAGIRQLHATGWMHPRARQIAASFLCFDLGVDWRIGRDEWDRYLVEDDAALATGNWQWTAGVGADLAAYPRIFNPLKQARRYDPNATYIRAWVPELVSAPLAEILDPSERVRRLQLRFALFASAQYPQPVVDHEVAARAFLARYISFAG